MRKVFAGLFISLDGVAESPDQWQFEFDEDMADAMAAMTAAQDAILLGRVTYQEWAPYWPTATDPFATIRSGLSDASPSGLMIRSPCAASCAARVGRTRKLTAAPASCRRPPK